jgi:hypothetical protein
MSQLDNKPGQGNTEPKNGRDNQPQDATPEKELIKEVNKDSRKGEDKDKFSPSEDKDYDAEEFTTD